jgi:hypothetical protein
MRPTYSSTKERSRRILLLTAYLVGWGGGVFGAPILLLMDEDAHDYELSSAGGRTHVVFHHGDHSESPPVNVWDTLCGHAAGIAKCGDHPDHEFHFFDQAAPAVVKFSSIPLSILLAAFSIEHLSIVVPKPPFQPVAATSTPPPGSLLRIVSTIVLLI